MFKFQIVMMRCNIVFILLAMVVALGQADNGIKDYNYLMFENFVTNEHIFRLETAVVKQIRSYRAHLEQARGQIQSLLSKTKAVKNELTELRFDLKSSIISGLEEKKRVLPASRELQTILGDSSPIYAIGAHRALSMLQETYNLNIMEMVNGRVSYKGKVFQVGELVKNDFYLIFYYFGP